MRVEALIRSNIIWALSPLIGCLVFPANAQNADVAVNGVSADVPYGAAGPVIYHQLKSCDGERGLAYIGYDGVPLPEGIRNLTNTTLDYVFTDVCFEAERGELTGFEGTNDLSLVRQDQIFERYEVLASASEGVLRRFVEIYRGPSPELDFGPDVTEFVFEQGVETVPRNLDGKLDNRSMAGYFLGTVFQPDPGADLGRYDVTVTNYSLDAGAAESRPLSLVESRHASEWAIPWFSGEITFSGLEGTASVVATNAGSDYDVAGNASGEGSFSLFVNSEGRVTGHGRFELSNPRLAGAAPDDWKTSSWQLIQVVGHLMGDTGETLAAIGLVRGTTVDHNDTVSRVLAVVEIGASRIE